MVDYTIYQLDESNLSISGGQQLDGITQGDGSHLLGETITLNSGSWTGINITDDDNSFQDSDSSQVLNGTQTIDGVSYTSGAVVEAEYSFTVTDGISTWTLIGFNVQNSTPVFATVEGIAVIGGPGGFPPFGVPLSIISTAEGPNYLASAYATPVCFTAGTQIRTPQGECLIENLSVGDVVETADHGARPIRWIGTQTMSALGKLAPIRFKAEAIGNHSDLLVSPEHRMVMEGWRSTLYFGQERVLVAAKHLVNDTNIRREEGGSVTYIHLLFDAHEIIWAQGALSESLHPGKVAMSSMGEASCAEILSIFPELEQGPAREMAAYTLTNHEAQLLL